ncbi:MAG: hypothetical protein HY720_32385 [Planctomycetes bacterium]|nr:hypothetical protein [Planctomycetota bacterium]
MGFFDSFRKKKISTAEELLEKIREIETRIDEEEMKLAAELESRLRSHFDRFWRFEEPHVRTQLSRIEDLFELGGEGIQAGSSVPAPGPIEKEGGSPAAAAPGEAPAGAVLEEVPSGESPAEEEGGGEGEKTPGADASAESEPLVRPPGLSPDEMKWVREILWQVWRKDSGTCHHCCGERELHFYPGAPEEVEETPAAPAGSNNGGSRPAQLERTPPEAGAVMPADEENASADSNAPAAEEEAESPIDESVTRQIVARLRVTCAACWKKEKDETKGGKE